MKDIVLQIEFSRKSHFNPIQNSWKPYSTTSIFIFINVSSEVYFGLFAVSSDFTMSKTKFNIAVLASCNAYMDNQTIVSKNTEYKDMFYPNNNTTYLK